METFLYLCALRDSNPRPSLCKSAALPTELRALSMFFCAPVLHTRSAVFGKAKVNFLFHSLVPPVGIEPTLTA